MHSRVRESAIGRFYWRTVKRWPMLYLLCCCVGLAVGIGALFLFGGPEPDAVKRIFLRVLGVLMLAVYSWWLASFTSRFLRGTWAVHCDSRIALFGGNL